MIRLKSSMILMCVFSVLFFFRAQAQIEDTTSKPSDTQYGNPGEDASKGTGTDFGKQSQIDTAAHFKLAKEITERLGQTLTITKEQENQIIERIVEFEENVADINMEQQEGKSDANTYADLDAELVSLVDDIEGMLDETQRAEWIKMKNDWMTEVKANIQSDKDVKSQDQKAE